MINKILIMLIISIAHTSNSYGGGSWIEEQKSNRHVENLYYKARRIAADLESQLKEERQKNKQYEKELASQKNELYQLQKENERLLGGCLSEASTKETQNLIIKAVNKEVKKTAKSIAESTAKEIVKEEAKKEVETAVKEAVKKVIK